MDPVEDNREGLVCALYSSIHTHDLFLFYELCLQTGQLIAEQDTLCLTENNRINRNYVSLTRRNQSFSTIALLDKEEL